MRGIASKTIHRDYWYMRDGEQPEIGRRYFVAHVAQISRGNAQANAVNSTDLAWSRLVRDQEVGGSNPLAPTTRITRSHIELYRNRLLLFHAVPGSHVVPASHASQSHVCRDIRALVAFATARVKPGNHARKFGLDSGEVDGMMGWLLARKE